MTEDSFKMLIDGRAVSADTTFEVLNPATGTVVAQAPDCSREQLDLAVAAARRAFPVWSATPIEDRKAALRALGDAVASHADDLARLLTAEQGKPVSAAIEEIKGIPYWLNMVAATDIPVQTHAQHGGRIAEVRRVPIGVVAAISPWNFPLMLAIWKIAPALMAGNTIVLKPSPLTPLSTLRMAELFAPLLPPGVLNVVTGGDALGPQLTAHPGIDKISFTGSSATGRKVMASAAADLKRVTLELGGNDAAIVLPDVDVEAIAPKIFWSAFANSGQVCVATKRLYVHEAVYDRLAQALVDYSKTVTVGDGANQGTQLGPIQNRQQFDRVKELLEDCRASGHRLLVGGEIPDGAGYFVPVTIIDNPPEDSRIVQEEQFGPVLPMLRFTDVSDVIARANASDYGLAGSVWATDADQATDIARKLDTGTVWINESQFITPGLPFGGRKQSGIGVENGIEGLLEFTAIQTLVRPAA